MKKRILVPDTAVPGITSLEYLKASGKTAMQRTTLSAPMRLITQTAYWKDYGPDRLDYGCGKGTDADLLGIEGWDPVYRGNSDILGKRYDIITMIYVLNTLPKELRLKTLETARGFLKPDGLMIVVVRDDVKQPYKTKLGTYRS